jgi:hypothetical protein
MYKNAVRTLRHQEISRAAKERQQHDLAIARISQSARHIGKMIYLHEAARPDITNDHPPMSPTQAPSSPSLTIPRAESTISNVSSKSGARVFYSTDVGLVESSPISRPHQQDSVSSVLNQEKIDRLMAKVDDAQVSCVPEWESRLNPKLGSKSKAKMKRSLTASADASVILLEKKLVAAVRSHYSHTIDTSAQQSALSTRVLLPFYKMSDVKHFLETFQKVDTDFR